MSPVEQALEPAGEAEEYHEVTLCLCDGPYPVFC